MILFMPYDFPIFTSINNIGVLLLVSIECRVPLLLIELLSRSSKFHYLDYISISE